MIRFWIREIAGWCLILLGLYIFLVVFANLLAPPPSQPRIFEAPIVVVIGVVVFRGGIHLLKVAVAARVCLQAQVELTKETPAVKPAKTVDKRWDW